MNDKWLVSNNVVDYACQSFIMCAIYNNISIDDIFKHSAVKEFLSDLYLNGGARTEMKLSQMETLDSKIKSIIDMVLMKEAKNNAC